MLILSSMCINIIYQWNRYIQIFIEQILVDIMITVTSLCMQSSGQWPSNLILEQNYFCESDMHKELNRRNSIHLPDKHHTLPKHKASTLIDIHTTCWKYTYSLSLAVPLPEIPAIETYKYPEEHARRCSRVLSLTANNSNVHQQECLDTKQILNQQAASLDNTGEWWPPT